MMLKSRGISNMHCYAFAPPMCCEPDLASTCSQCVTSVIFRDDIISRYGSPNYSDIVYGHSTILDQASAVLINGCDCIWIGMTYAACVSKRSDEGVHGSRGDEEGGGMQKKGVLGPGGCGVWRATRMGWHDSALHGQYVAGQNRLQNPFKHAEPLVTTSQCLIAAEMVRGGLAGGSIEWQGWSCHEPESQILLDRTTDSVHLTRQTFYFCINLYTHGILQATWQNLTLWCGPSPQPPRLPPASQDDSLWCMQDLPRKRSSPVPGACGV